MLPGSTGHLHAEHRGFWQHHGGVVVHVEVSILCCFQVADIGLCRSLWLGIMTGYPHLYAHLRSEGLLGDYQGAAGDHFLDETWRTLCL
eukprot:6265620-Amphidinium_carterae.1